MTSILDYFRGSGRIAARGGRHAIKSFTYTGKSIAPKSPSGKRIHRKQRKLL